MLQAPMHNHLLSKISLERMPKVLEHHAQPSMTDAGMIVGDMIHGTREGESTFNGYTHEQIRQGAEHYHVPSSDAELGLHGKPDDPALNGKPHLVRHVDPSAIGERFAYRRFAETRLAENADVPAHGTYADAATARTYSRMSGLIAAKHLPLAGNMVTRDSAGNPRILRPDEPYASKMIYGDSEAQGKRKARLVDSTDRMPNDLTVKLRARQGSPGISTMIDDNPRGIKRRRVFVDRPGDGATTHFASHRGADRVAVTRFATSYPTSNNASP